MTDGASWRQVVDQMVDDRLLSDLRPSPATVRHGRWLVIVVPVLVISGWLLLSVRSDIQIQQQRLTVIDGPQTPTSLDLWAYINAKLPTKAVVVFRKPFVISLFGHRISHVIIPLDSRADLPMVEQAYRDNSVTYFVYDISDSTGQIEDWLNHFLDWTTNIHEVWRNSRYIIYGWRN